MEDFFNNSTLFLFFFAMLSIFNYTDMRMEQRLSVIYISVYAMTMLGTIGTKTAYLFLFLTLFCYLEIFTTDTRKLQLLVNPIYKLVDCIYLAFAQYNLFYVLLAVSCLSYTLTQRFGRLAAFFKVLSLPILCVAITKVLQQKFSLKTFRDMYRVFDQYPIYQVDFNDKLDQASDILVTIEDRRYFEREGYTFLDIKHLTQAIKRKLKDKNFKEKCSSGKKFIGDIVTFRRGYSTIPMQIIRSLGIERGYDCKIRRKIYELLYPKMFFDGMKREMDVVRAENRYKFEEYLLYIYFHVTKTDMGDGYYRNFLGVFDAKHHGKEGKNIYDCTNEGIFIACMGLSGRARKISADNIDYYLQWIPVYLNKRKILNMKEKMMSKPYNGNYLE